MCRRNITTNFIFIMTQLELATRIKEVTPSLQRSAYYFTGNMDDASDLFQDTMVAVTANIDKFSPETNFHAWCQVVLKNLFYNKWRQKNSRPPTVPTSEQYCGSVVDPSPMDFTHIWNTIDHLPKPWSTVMMLRVSGYGYQEISDKLGIPLGTVKSRISLSRKRLSKDLAEYLF